MSLYLHYWWGDYQSPWKNYDFNTKKNELLASQIQHFNKVTKKQSFSGNTSAVKDYEKTLEIFLNDNKNSERKAIFESIVPSNFLSDVKSSGVNGMSYAQLNNAIKKGMVDISQVANSIQSFLNKLQENLDTCFKTFYGESASWEAYQAAVVQEYCANKGIDTKDSSKIRESILSDFKNQSDGFKKLTVKNSNNSVLESAMRKMVLAAEGLKAMIKNSSGKVQVSDSSYFNEIARVMVGLMTDASSSGLELISTAIENGLLDGKVLDKLESVFETKVINGSAMNIGTRVSKDPNAEQAKKEGNKAYSSNTADVGVSFSLANGLIIQYGINVKNYQVKTNKSGEKYLKQVKIKDSFSFKQLLDDGMLGFKGDGFYTYLYNLAGSHPGSKEKADTKGGSELTAKWRELVKLVGYAGILRALVGTGVGMDNSLIFLANGVPYTMDEVLSKLMSSSDKTDIAVSSKIRNRGPLMAYNVWVDDDSGGKSGPVTRNEQRRNTTYASLRSIRAIDNISGVINSAKISIYMNFFSNLLT